MVELMVFDDPLKLYRKIKIDSAYESRGSWGRLRSLTLCAVTRPHTPDHRYDQMEKEKDLFRGWYRPHNQVSVA